MSFAELPQSCRDIILGYWSAVKEIKQFFEPYEQFVLVGHMIGHTGCDLYQYTRILDEVKEFARYQINVGIRWKVMKEEIQWLGLQLSMSDLDI